MRSSTLSIPLIFASCASAIITGIAVPAALAPGQPFSFNLTTSNAQQPIQDVAVAWGYTLPTANKPTGNAYALGSYPSSQYLGPTVSNVLPNVLVNGTVASQLSSSPWYGSNVVFTVAVFSLTGASSGSLVQGWNATVLIEDTTAVTTVASDERAWVENGSC